MSKEIILVIDDKPNIREVLCAILENEGYQVVTCKNAEESLEIVRRVSPDLIVTDLKLPDQDGITLTRDVKQIDPTLPVLLITAFGTISSAVEAIKAGAYDYLTKPIDYERLKLLIKRVLDQKRINLENRFLKEELENKYRLDNLVGKGNTMRKLFNLIKNVAPSNSNVLIQGECGTGKELIARALYNLSGRKGKPLIVVDCSALPEGLLESELFGHEKGAFTGADTRKKGRIELAHQGTLFLDEIGEMSLPLQAKLLRVIQERQFVRLGGLETVKIDFRLIASTNRNLKEEVARGAFRSDLYYRLNVIDITVPPLRERKEDIPLLVENFMNKIRERDRMESKSISPDVMDILMRYDWPGNVRELENCIERLMVFCPSPMITTEYLPEEILNTVDSVGRGKKPGTLQNGRQNRLSLPELEKETILEALRETGWNKSKAARLLNIDRKALYNRLKKYNLES